MLKEREKTEHEECAIINKSKTWNVAISRANSSSSANLFWVTIALLNEPGDFNVNILRACLFEYLLCNHFMEFQLSFLFLGLVLKFFFDDLKVAIFREPNIRN